MLRGNQFYSTIYHFRPAAPTNHTWKKEYLILNPTILLFIFPQLFLFAQARRLIAGLIFSHLKLDNQLTRENILILI